MISATTWLAGVASRARPVARAAEVVDHDLRPFAREEERMGAADAAARARDDGDLAVEKTHGTLRAAL